MCTHSSFRSALIRIGCLAWCGLLALPVGAGLLPLSDVVQVSAGLAHSCAVTGNGAVRCWGSNEYGQLGDGGSTDRNTPVQVSGLDSGVQQVGVGRDHSCALTGSGAVLCWGRNEFGQLGDGTTTQRLLPVPVSGLSGGVQAIGVGGSFSCALNASGAVLCWGGNTFGSLGDGSTSQRSVPGLVSGLSTGVAAISTGNAHACAIVATSGALRCWGYNAGGQLGNGSTESQVVPATVSGLGGGVATVAAGVLHTCATLAATGAARCWGNNFRGQLGDGSFVNRTLPVDVSGLSGNVVRLGIGHYHSCAQLTDGTVRCWGDNYHGQLGIGAGSHGQPTSAALPGLDGIVSLAAGHHHACAVASDGMARCWGANNRGQIGMGETALPGYGRMPTDVLGLTSGVVALTSGSEHSCALTVGGAVKCWGRNLHGQLGDGSRVRRFSPATVTSLPGAVQMLAAGVDHTCALVAGAVRCWGSNQYRQLGAPGDLGPHPPVGVNLPGSTTMISAGDRHTCALNSAGRVSCWGMVPFVGSGGVPGTLADLVSGIVSIAAGGDHNCALTHTGVVRCWGSNGSGQFGYHGDDSPYQTVPVSGLSPGVQALSAGAEHTCMRSTTGRIECWGRSNYGQGGDPGPVGYAGLGSGVQSVSAGGFHNCVVIDGTARCWGNNALGQLGDGTMVNAYVPVDVIGLGGGVQAVVSGNTHSCALTSAGGVQCWGDNYHGQLGDGSFPGVPLPQVVKVDLAFFRSGFEAGEGE
ncbi:hypothetical protein OS187_06990 [Xanthomonadaceae bacterium JHOS43]|nr:hypothetical protein [Xanthomonadaceae bacterium JHOS43]MCX7562936.1 hypothetical protein [Xanthomonadaceae bacterium XH05]